MAANTREAKFSRVFFCKWRENAVRLSQDCGLYWIEGVCLCWIPRSCSSIGIGMNARFRKRQRPTAATAIRSRITSWAAHRTPKNASTTPGFVHGIRSRRTGLSRSLRFSAASRAISHCTCFSARTRKSAAAVRSILFLKSWRTASPAENRQSRSWTSRSSRPRSTRFSLRFPPGSERSLCAGTGMPTA